MKIDKKIILISVIAIAVGAALTLVIQFFFGSGNLGSSSVGGVVYQTQDNLDYKFIKPLLDVGYINQEDSLQQFPLHARVKSLVEEEIKKYPDVDIGFYFNDLSNAGWFGINENEKFIPASLLKLPILISYYKLRETEPDLFEQKILYRGSDMNEVRNLPEESVIKPSNTYTVHELLESMIISSDNNEIGRASCRERVSSPV